MDVIGVIGMALILWTFTMVQSHRWNQDSLRYDIFNAVGSALLVAYALEARAWPFVLLNGVWALYSAKDILADARRLRLRSRITQ